MSTVAHCFHRLHSSAYSALKSNQQVTSRVAIRVTHRTIVNKYFNIRQVHNTFEGWRWHLTLCLDLALYGQSGTKLLRLSNNEYGQADGQWRRHAVAYERRPGAIDRIHYYMDEAWISTTEVGADCGVWSQPIPSGGARFLAANVMPGVFYALDNIAIAKT